MYMHPLALRTHTHANTNTLARTQDIAVPIKKGDPDELRRLLVKCASTSLNSKVICVLCRSGYLCVCVRACVYSMENGADHLLPF